MVVAHFGIAVALFGMASDSAFTTERLAALEPGQSAQAGPWRVTLDHVTPVAGPNWTAIQGTLSASYKGGTGIELNPQHRSFWAPVQETTESALATRWNGQLYAVIGEEAAPGTNGVGRWQVRLWWKPFVTWIWYGGVLVALGGVLALVGRVVSDVKRRSIVRRSATRREDARAFAAEPAE